MSCGHCKSTIENSLKDLTGINETKIDLENKTVTIDFVEDIIKLDEIIDTINKLGYNTSIR